MSTYEFISEAIRLEEESSGDNLLHFDNTFFKDGVVVPHGHDLPDDIKEEYNSSLGIDVSKITYWYTKYNDKYFDSYDYLYVTTSPSNPGFIQGYMNYSPVMCDEFLQQHARLPRKDLIELFCSAYTGSKPAKRKLSKLGYSTSNKLEYITSSKVNCKICLNRLIGSVTTDFYNEKAVEGAIEEFLLDNYAKYLENSEVVFNTRSGDDYTYDVNVLFSYSPKTVQDEEAFIKKLVRRKYDIINGSLRLEHNF